MAYPKQLLLFAILAVAILAWSPVSWAQSEEDILRVALQIIQDNSHSSEPCDDFYNYACGGFYKHHRDGDYGNYSTYAVVNFDQQLHSFLDTKYPHPDYIPKSRQNFAEKTASYFYSCKTVTNNFDKLKYLDEITPGHGLDWPLVEEMDAFRRNYRFYDSGSWPSAHFDAFALMGRLYSYGVREMLVDGVSKSNLYLTPGDMTPLDATVVDNLLSGFGLPKDKLDEYRDEIIEFQQHWQYIHGIYAEARDAEVLRDHNINEFMKNAFPWDLRENPDVRTSHKDYFRYLLGKQWTPSEERVFCNYLMVKLLQYVEKNYKNNYAENVRTKLGLALNYMYYEHEYLPKAEAINSAISELIKYVELTYMLHLNKNRINFTKEQTKYVIDHMMGATVNVGNLPQNVTFAKVDKLYSALADLNADNFYKNDLLLLAHRQHELELCREDKTMICDTSITGIVYNRELNVLAIPFLSLQLPMYDIKLNDLFIYPTIGFQVAHALTRAIDSEFLQGTHFTESFHQITDNPNYRHSIDCLRQLPHTYDLNERIADMVGAEVAISAYSGSRMDWKKLDLSQLNKHYTWDELFFRYFAQQFCTTNTGEFMPDDVQRARLHAVLKNEQAFAEAFKCQEGTRMNPRDKCHFY